MGRRLVEDVGHGVFPSSLEGGCVGGAAGRGRLLCQLPR
ncbi:hypothetical protein FM106_17200 [Brachybacterium faecium]|nr:hypothetical protein FM106_17200 [Brachybacterium faecium]